VGRPLLSDPFGVAMAALFTMWPDKTRAKICGDDESAQVFESWMTSLGVPAVPIEVLRHAVASNNLGSEGSS